jgi:endoribonuclease Dicer
LDACEDISCDFIDFDSSSSTTLDNNNNSTTTTTATAVDDVLLPTPTSNQDFFGGIDRIFDSIKNGDGLPQPNALALALAVQEQEQEEDNRCNKRARLAGCYNNNHDRKINHQPTNDRFERSFNNNRKRPRDGGVTDTRKKKRLAGGNHHHHHHGGYWVRDKSGSNDLVFRSGNWEPNSTHQDNIKQEKEEEEEETHHTTDLPAKEKLPEEKARQYQLDVLEQAKNRNTIAFLETGAGKTLIAVLLIKSIHHTLHHQNKKMLAVFLVPKVPLVYQVIYPLSHNNLLFNAMQLVSIHSFCSTSLFNYSKLR